MLLRESHALGRITAEGLLAGTSPRLLQLSSGTDSGSGGTSEEAELATLRQRVALLGEKAARATELELENARIEAEIAGQLPPGAHVRLAPTQPRRVVVMVSREHHCLADLLVRQHFGEFFDLLPTRADSEHSWTVMRDAIEASNFDLKAVNPHGKSSEDLRTPEELIDIIEARGREVEAAIAELRRLL